MRRLTNRTRVVFALLATGIWFLPTWTAAVTFPLVWRWANPTPHGNNIIDMASRNGVWIQVAERGQVYSSRDLAVWEPGDSHTSSALRAVTFFNDLIVISGENGTILTGPAVTNLTLIDLGVTDWLEGVAASDRLAVAVGDNAAIYTSPDGSNWQRQTPPFNDWLRSVAYGPPGSAGLFVAVGEAGAVTTSTDGIHWQTPARFTSEDLNRVSWSNGQFWALGDAGVTFQSSTGSKWQAVRTGATNTLNAFAASGIANLVAGDAEVRLGRTPAAWTDELADAQPFPPPVWTYLSAAPLTNNFLLCGRSGMIVEGLLGGAGGSTNVWFPLSDSLWNWLWDVKHFPSAYIAVGDRATILTSVDGYAWDPELPPDAATNSIFLGIGGRTNLALAVGNAGVILTSSDTQQSVVSTNANGSLVTNVVGTLGITWRAVAPRPTTQDLQGVGTWGDLLVICGGGGTILTSPDAVTWTKRTTPTSTFLSSIESFPNGLVAVGKGGTILTSPDAAAWSQRTSSTTDWIYKVRYVGGKLIAVGQNGMILTSNDGQSWTSRRSGVTNWLNDVQFVDGTYFVIGNQGTVLTSPDTTQWTSRGTITGKSLFGAATDDSMLIVIGVEGVVLRSLIAAIPPPRTNSPLKFLKFPARPEENQFQFSGTPGQKFTLDRSTNILNWTVGPQLQLDASGTLPYSDPGTNSPLFQFFRATPR